MASATTSTPRSQGGKHVLRTHWPAHTPENGWAIPTCRAGAPDGDYQPAAPSRDEVTCQKCRRMLATRARRGAAAAGAGR
jgi:hypothetical protein